MELSRISENFLHYVWKFGLFDKNHLTTVKGETVKIINAGLHNHDAGPDFSSGQLIIDDKKWIGNIELHICSSDWNKHAHDDDDNYRNVILHVVYIDDAEIKSLITNNVPTLVLKDRIDPQIFKNYLALQSSETEILCSSHLANVNPLIITGMIEKCSTERLANKSVEIERIFSFTENDWEKTFYILLGKYFGVSVNTDPFERLTRSLDLHILYKHRADPTQIEALLHGQSGILPSSHTDPVVSHLITEYDFLKQKYKLSPLPFSVWKFARMRPVSFPTIRISQFADLIASKEFLFSSIIKSDKPEEIIALLDCKASEFFNTHYHFSKESNYLEKKLGKNTKELLVINAVAPLLYFYGIKMDDRSIIDNALILLESLKSEKNKIIRTWNAEGVTSQDALQSQGLIELTKSYCRNKRCVDCNIGYQVLKA